MKELALGEGVVKNFSLPLSLSTATSSAIQVSLKWNVESLHGCTKTKDFGGQGGSFELLNRIVMM